MKAAYFLRPKHIEVQEVPLRPLKREEVRIRVFACGVCGTDVHIYHSGKGSVDVTDPVILGHEFAGVITELGEDAGIFQVGDHVTVDPNIYCGKCRPCRIGKKQMCENLHAVGVNQDGGFAQYCTVPQKQCYRLDPRTPLRLGALTEPLACCIHGIDRAGIRHGDTVCVIGGGAIGLIMVQLARLGGAGTVILSEPEAMRREIGLRLGADWAVDPVHEDMPARVRELLGSDGADVVIECVGNMAATAQAFTAAGSGANILLFSVPKEDAQYAVKLEDVYRKELTIMGSRINPDTHQRAAQLIDSGKLQLEPLITHSFPVERLEEAIRTQMGPQSIKVLIEPDREAQEG